MKSLIRAIFVTLTMMIASLGLFLSGGAEAGTPVTGDILSDTVWSPAGSPYWIETNVTVRLGVELVVLAGTEIRFNGYYRLNIVGRLLVEGNGTDPVIITHNSTTPSPGDWAGIYVFGSTHVNHVNISYAYVGLYVATSFATVNDSFFYRNEAAIGLMAGTDNVIRNNTLFNSTYCGIVVWQSTSNELIGNNATRNGDTGVWLDETSGNLVQQNTLYRNYWNGIRIGGGSTDNVVVENTILESQLYQGVGIWDSHDNFILNNTIRRNNNNGVYVESSSGNNISWNEISDSLNYHGISLYNADSNVMIGNHIFDVWLDGVYMSSAPGNRIYNNTIHDNWEGVYMFDSWMSEIRGNSISANSNGITSWSSSWSDIVSNNISQNTNIGMYLEDNNNYLEITNNSFFLNSGSAVFASLSDQVTVSGNDFYGNLRGVNLVDSSNVSMFENNFAFNSWYGVDLTSSRDISVYHNNFIGNANQAGDDLAAENEWDDGYPSGGNYWDDYGGIDIRSGPNQNLPGSDWIGDSPYVIDMDSQDEFPLMYPFGMIPSLPPTAPDAHLSGANLENVTLTWNLSLDDGGGRNNVVEYAVYRGTTYDGSGLSYDFLANVSNGTSIFVDSYVGDGNSTNFFYRVCSVNDLNLTSCSWDQAAKFTHQGWPLMSIPLIQSNESIEHVLRTVEYDRAWYYDSLGQEWKWHMPFKNYRRGLWTLNHTMGLWVVATGASTLTVAGVVPTQTTIQLHKGWNLVSFPSFNTSYTVADLKADTGATRVEGFIETMPPLPSSRLWVLGSGEVLVAGQGYWVKVEADTVWNVNAS